MKITVWSDFACPYCYIGEIRLMNAIADLGLTGKVEIEYKAYELNPKASPAGTASTTAERMAGKYRIPLKEAEAKVAEISQLGNDLNLEFNYASAKYTNTRLAHELMKFAESKGDKEKVRKLNFALFDAYFGKNQFLADITVLAAVAGSVGFDPKEAETVLTSGEYEDAVRRDEYEAERHGVHGVPYFLFNEKFVVPGALSSEGYKEVLKREMDEDSRKNSHGHVVHEHPHFCSDKGCSLPDNEKQQLEHEF